MVRDSCQRRPRPIKRTRQIQLANICLRATYLLGCLDRADSTAKSFFNLIF
jgi:hypothetical protein